MILGIDYGIKNVGLAISDESEKFAVALTTLGQNNLVQNISKILIDKFIYKVVVGNPVRMNGEEGYVTKLMNTFVDELKNNVSGLQVILIDESMTTRIAIDYLRNMGYTSKDIEKRKDQESARIILQSYLDNNVV
ncbi:MAG: Holliday junction resolvase RuvX [bacterium]